MREMGHACVFRGAPQSRGQFRSRIRAGGCRGKGRHFHAVNHSLFFPLSYRSNNPTVVQSTGRSTVPSLWDSPCTVPVVSLSTSHFADSGQQLVAVEAQAPMWLNHHQQKEICLPSRSVQTLAGSRYYFHT